jgi:hypothetical protein
MKIGPKKAAPPIQSAVLIFMSSPPALVLGLVVLVTKERVLAAAHGRAA